MIQAAKFNFKTKTEAAPSKAKLDQKAVIGLAVLVLGAAIYFYVRYLTSAAHHRGMTAASRAVVAAITPAAAASAAAGAVKSSPMAIAPASAPVSPVVAAAVVSAPSNSVPPAAAPVSFGDSLMAVLSPSAKAETLQAPLSPAPAMDVPASTPAARQTLKSPAPVKRVMHVDEDDVPLTDAQKLAQLTEARFGEVVEMAAKNPDVFGFGSKERPDMATLGAPIVVYTITPADQRNYRAGQPIAPLLQATNEWIYPVMLGGRMRYMLPIRRVDGEYVALPGSRALAMVYEKIGQRWPGSAGYHPQLVVNANMANYYFTIPELPEQNLTDIGDMFEYRPTLSPASVILASWQ